MSSFLKMSFKSVHGLEPVKYRGVAEKTTNYSS
jgi:hypothetical protein